MGCGQSGKKEAKDPQGSVQANRRRLSVGTDPETVNEDSNIGGEENRGLISQLDNESLMELCASMAGEHRKMSIGSTTDQGKVSFANKSVKEVGDKVIAEDNFWGYTCRKGLKPESPNQDSWFILKVEGGFTMYAVFDGHGQKGHDVSNYVKENLPKMIVKDSRFRTDEMTQMLTDVFKKTQSLVSTADRMKKLSAQMSGTTATVVVHDENLKTLTVAHVADSSAVLGRYTSEKKLEAIALTRDHKPNLKDEKARIERSGGRVVFDGYANHRIYAKNARYPGLNMSRCIGDLLGHQDCGIIAEPEVSKRDISDQDAVLLVCSDGVWEFINGLEAVTIVMNYPPKQAMAAAEKLAKEAWDRWITEEGGAVVDDITVVLVFLNAKTGQENNSASVTMTRPS